MNTKISKANSYIEIQKSLASGEQDLLLAAEMIDEGQVIHYSRPEMLKPGFYSILAELDPSQKMDAEIAYKFTNRLDPNGMHLKEIHSELYIAIDYDQSIVNNEEAIKYNKANDPLEDLGNKFDIFKLRMAKVWNS